MEIMKIEDIFKKSIELETDRLIIRRLTFNDVADMFEYASNPMVTKYLPWEAHKSIEDTMNFLNMVLDSYKKGQVSGWGIVLKENSKLIGTCGYVWWQTENEKAEIGYALSPDYWNRGIVTEAAKEIIKFGFENMRLNRIEAHCVDKNIASERIMQKIGMKYEGLLRDFRKFKGKYCDFKMYSILKKEWDKK